MALLDRFRQCYRQGKLEDLVGEWRACKCSVKDEGMMEGVALPRPRACAVHAEVLAQATRGCKLWLELKRSVVEWRDSSDEHWLSVEVGDCDREYLQYWAAVAPSALQRAPSAVPNSATGAVKKKKKKDRVAEKRNGASVSGIKT